MPSIPSNGFQRNCSSVDLKQNMILSEEEEETATLAEPMTVEGARHLAHPNGVPETPSSISPVPHGLLTVSPPLLTSPSLIHPILTCPSRSPLLHPLSSPPGQSTHSLIMPSHLTSPGSQLSALHHTLWAPSTISQEDDEMTDYPSTVDIQAIRDSPSPEPREQKLMTINEHWDQQEEESTAIHINSNEDDSSTADEEEDDDSSDSDTNSSDSTSVSSFCSNSQDISQNSKATPNKPSPRLTPPSIAGSVGSNSESDCEDSGTESDSSSDDQSSAGETCDREQISQTVPKVAEELLVNVDMTKTGSKERRNHSPVSHRSNSDKVIDSQHAKILNKTDADQNKKDNPRHSESKSSQMTVKVTKDTNSAVTKNNNMIKKAKLCHQAKDSCSPKPDECLPLIHPKKLIQPRMYSPVELQRRRLAKKKEMDQEFDRLLNTSEPDKSDDSQDSSDDEEDDDLNELQSANSPHVVGPQFESVLSCQSKLDAHMDSDRKETCSRPASTIVNRSSNNSNTSLKHVNTHVDKKVTEHISPTHSKCLRNGVELSDSSSEDDQHRVKSATRKEYYTSSKFKQLPTEAEFQRTECAMAVPQKPVHKSSNSTSERGSALCANNDLESKKTTDVDDDITSFSDVSDDMNEKVDLDTEQTQTFSVSENNFNQDCVTMKIAAMIQNWKFGKTGSDWHGSLNETSCVARRAVNRPKKHASHPKCETQKVKTAAERKTYTDAISSSSVDGSNKSKSKVIKNIAKVAGSAYGLREQTNQKSQPAADKLQDLNQADLVAVLPVSEKKASVSGQNEDSSLPTLDGLSRDKPIDSSSATAPTGRRKAEVVRSRDSIPKQTRKHKSIPSQMDPSEEDAMPHLESFVPLDHNGSNVSPDSGIQSVSGSPLHHVGSPTHPPPHFYSSGLIGAGLSASNCGPSCPDTVSVSREGPSLNRPFCANYSHQDSPSPPTLVPAVTPPHLSRSPRYYSDTPDSPPMPSLTCQVDLPPWQSTVSDSLTCQDVEPRIDSDDDVVAKPKRSRGRPKGSKNKKKTDVACADDVQPIETSADLSTRSVSKSIETPIPQTPTIRSEDKTIIPIKRGPGRPKKVKDPLEEPKQDCSETIDGRSKVKRPVGRPRKQHIPEQLIDDKCPPATLASRKCFNDNIMPTIINEKVRSSEKSDKLTLHHKKEDIPSDLHGSKDGRCEDERSRKTKRKTVHRLLADGIPLVEDKKKKKRGRRKELPAIFGKVYGTDKLEIRNSKKRKSRKKPFKSKHKNIIDPVFLEKLEDLIVDFEGKCCISKNLECPISKRSQSLLPSIFRTRKVTLTVKKRRGADKVKTSDKESGTDGETREKLAGKRKKKILEVPKQGRERSEANEQRLPLKKRHRHISTGVGVCADPPKMENAKTDLSKSSNECKDKTSLSKCHHESAKNIKAETKTLKNSQESRTDPATSKRRVESKSVSRDFAVTANSPQVTTCASTHLAEESAKRTVTYQPMVPTTPKKRHRLEADICSSLRVPAEQCDPDKAIPTPAKECTVNKPTTNPLSSKIKQEKEQVYDKIVLLPPHQPLVTTCESKSKLGEVLECENRQEPQKDVPLVNPTPYDNEDIYSDSDIPSEHELLGESDISGFMSDKEGDAEENMSLCIRRRKRRRGFRASQKTISDKPIDVSQTPPEVRAHKKKRRKTNRTGFPTVKRKKKKIKLEETRLDDCSALSQQQLPLSSMDPKVCIEQLSLSDSLQYTTQMSSVCVQTTKRRGRPRKIKCAEKEPSKLAVDEGLTESMKDAPRLGKRIRKIAEDDIEDSDTVVSVDYQPSSEPASSDESGRLSIVRQKVPRFRRKYLVAGLLSSYYKQDECDRKCSEVVPTGRSKLLYEPDQHKYGLLPPPSYCKKQLRQTVIDFTLPYDLWYLEKAGALPGRDVVPSWNYKKVKANVYYDVKPTHEFDIQACNCKRPAKPGDKSCGEDCINRMMFIECSAQICPVNETCSNQRLQKHENLICLQKFMTLDKGWGMKLTAHLKQGTFIMEYVGEVVSEREFRYRMQTKYANDTHHYCLNLDRGMMIDGHRIGSDCRFVNHSCDPNCEMQKWNVNGQYRMALFALKDINQFEELTYDYNFHLFNPTQGQQCRCRAAICRGVIGGRSQRLNAVPVTEPKRKSAGRNKNGRKRKRGTSTDTDGGCLARFSFMPIKPLSHQQRLFILSHRCFLVRNVEKMRKARDRIARYHEKKHEEVAEPAEEPGNKIQRFLTHFTALNTARSVKTRRLAQAEDDPEMTRLAKLAQIFKDIYDKLVASRDQKDKPLATPFMNLPSKKKYASYYTRVGEPIDLYLIEKNILTGHYTCAQTFDDDVMRLFANNLRFFGRNTEVGQMAVGLRKVYSECKLQFKPLLEEVLGESRLPAAFENCCNNEEFIDEDVIRCVCNLYRDEGTMIQCERCLVWQHCDCMSVDEQDFPEHYLCEECAPRIVSPEVPMTPQPPDSNNKKHFVTLLRDNLQIKQGDSVYILRDRPKQKPAERRQPAYKLAKDIKLHELLIFKVESLFIDEKGDKYTFGHHYLRPHETFHEPMRKFYTNEVIRSPYCEILPLDMVIRHCWVMDLNSYCRGRPIGCVEEHVYVCEFRVDKRAHVFSKISKPKYPICKKPYAFVTFPVKLKPQRTYMPHELIFHHRRGKQASRKNANASTGKEDTVSEKSAPSSSSDSAPGTPVPSSRNNSGTRKCRSNASSRDRSETPSEEVLPDVKRKQPNRNEKQLRVNDVATKLLHRLPTKGAVDLAYLLENNKRQRKKTTAFAS